MDESVKQALAKWPNVPACTGWLALDRRGNWRMRDEAAQQNGAPGSPIRHAALLAFIGRNYQADEGGRWYFQNGPQRVYVELAYTPWIVRLQLAATIDPATPGELTLTDQCGGSFEPSAGWLDDAGAVLFSDATGRIALLHDHDLDLLTEHATLSDTDHPAPAAGTDAPIAASLHWRRHQTLPLTPIFCSEVETRFHFVRSPAAAMAV